MISPAKTAADSRYWRSIKYSLFPPLGLATLAGYLDPDDEVDLQDEHVETLRLDDEPDLVVIEAYITSAGRAYRYADHYRARGAYVCLGGLHPTSLPDEAARHADSVFCGPGEDIWPAFLRDFRAGRPQAALPLDRADARRPPAGAPRPHQARALPGAQLAGREPRLPARLRLLLQGGVLPRRQVVLRAGGRRCPRRDRPPPRPPPLLPRRQPVRQPAVRRGAVRRPARAWAACGRRPARSRPCSAPGLLEKAVESGLRSLFIGFETLSEANLRGAGKTQNLAGAASGRRGREPPARRSTTPPSAASTTSASWSTALRLRHGPRRSVGLRAHGRLGGEPGRRDGDVPHHDAVSRHPARARGSRPRAASPAATGISTTRGTPSSRRPA